MESPTFQELPYPADSTRNSEQAVTVLLFGSYPSSLHTKTHLQFRAKLLAFSSVSAFPTLLYHIFYYMTNSKFVFKKSREINLSSNFMDLKNIAFTNISSNNLTISTEKCKKKEAVYATSKYAMQLCLEANSI